MPHLLSGPRVSKRLRRSKVGDVPRVLRERGYGKATFWAVVPRVLGTCLAKGERRGVSSTWTATTRALIFRR